MNAKNVDLSVAIPTYNEAKTIAKLVEGISEAFNGSGINIEFIVVDDNSPDGTAEKAKEMEGEYTLKVIVRKDERGLGTAVVRGWEEAKGRFLAVIDGDMQHPPDIIRKLYNTMVDQGADLAIASRKAAGGGTKNWSFYRVVISETATKIAKVILPVTLFKIQDATTGCFMFKKENVDLKKLKPRGFKIFLEVLAKGKFKKPVEVPYIFDQRSLGESKMTMQQNMLFLKHLFLLSIYTGEILILIVLLSFFALAVYFFGWF